MFCWWNLNKASQPHFCLGQRILFNPKAVGLAYLLVPHSNSFSQLYKLQIIIHNFGNIHLLQKFSFFLQPFPTQSKMGPPNILSCTTAHSKPQAHQEYDLLFSTCLYAGSCFNLHSGCTVGLTWVSWGEAFSLFNLPHVLLGSAPLCSLPLPCTVICSQENVSNFDSILNKINPGFLRGNARCIFLRKMWAIWGIGRTIGSLR